VSTQLISSSIAAGGIATPFLGQQYETVGDNSTVQIGILAEATGILQTVFMGNDLVMEESPSKIGAANAIPIWPDDFLVSENVYAGTKLKVQLRNSSGGTIVVKTAVRINPL
jgi:hypothetical protein